MTYTHTHTHILPHLQEELKQENAELRFKLVDVEMSRVMDQAEIKRLKAEVESTKTDMASLRSAASQLSRIQSLLMTEEGPTETAA